MAEVSAPTVPNAAAAMVPGRHGRADGAPGLIAQQRLGAGFALLTARSGQHAELERAMLAAFGVALPAIGKRRAGDPLKSQRLALTGIGPGRWLAEIPAQPPDGIEEYLRDAIGSRIKLTFKVFPYSHPFSITTPKFDCFNTRPGSK